METLKFERMGSSAVVTLNRPGKLNAINPIISIATLQPHAVQAI